MEIGKLPNEVLQKIVLDNITHKRKEVLVHAGIGEDCAIVEYGKKACIISSDPITGADKNIGKLAINISANDIAASGGEPIGVVITMLIPPNKKISDIEEVMKDAGEEAKKLNMEIIGGHTEITDVVNKIVLITTVIGIQDKDKILSLNKKIVPGDKIIITKDIALEGTSIIAHDLEKELKGKLSREIIKEAKNMTKEISVVKDGKISFENGAKYMHDITEGGILGAIWEAKEANNCGIKLYSEKIPVRRSTKEIASIMDIDYLKLISSGSMLIIASEKDSKRIVEKLEEKRIKGTIVGEITKENKAILIKGDKEIEILPPESDEIYKVI